MELEIRGQEAEFKLSDNQRPIETGGQYQDKFDSKKVLGDNAGGDEYTNNLKSISVLDKIVVKIHPPKSNDLKDSILNFLLD